MTDTIFALASGSPPAAIGVVRISGPSAAEALQALAGQVPQARRATVSTLVHPQGGDPLDTALLLFFPAPATATGEDIAELHLHGGRAVVAGVLQALTCVPGLRAAEAGEFTRRAFENGRIDLAEAEGLADLLSAETDSQRRAALSLAGGALSRAVEDWQRRLLGLAARLEATIDFADEDEAGAGPPSSWLESLEALTREMEAQLERPPVERLRDGVRIVIAGPPNAGKSSLLNAIAGREAAITSAAAGTTRDVIEAPVAIAGVPLLLVDTAGLRDSCDTVEAEGVARARDRLDAADLILWLGAPDQCPDPARSVLVQSKVDLAAPEASVADVRVSALTGEGLPMLTNVLLERTRALMPVNGEVALNRRHRNALADCVAALGDAGDFHDPLLAAEQLRFARAALDRITGRAGVEDMLDSLFGRFCIGK